MAKLGLRLTLSALALGSLFGAHPANEEQREHFEMKVRPLLASECYACHRQSAMGGLRLDSKKGLLEGGKHGPAIVPGKAEESLLIQAVTHSHDRLKMPPQRKLKPEQIDILKAWIKDGAYWPEDDAPQTESAQSSEYVISPEQRAFWSFQPIKKTEPPQVKDASWPRGPIDRFILARLEQEGLRPVKPADKRTLIRRATLDLIGLPPTPEEVDAFLADNSPDAFAKVVDRLLASPHYGERWARYWLDLARYSDDSLNSTKDEPYPNSFRYRNWVIRAFNEDMPYNLFVKAQIAGDMMASNDPNQYAAGLGFYALSPEMQDERVDATTRGFLGLTVACAQCHDHKYDPIPTKDYYSLQGIFSSTQLDELPLAPAHVVDAWKAQEEKVKRKETQIQRFYDIQRQQIAEILASQTAAFMLAARGLRDGAGLDAETLSRWKNYLASPDKEHPFLKKWFDLAARGASEKEFEREAYEFQQLVLDVLEEKREVDEKNKITLGLNPQRNDIANASLVSLSRDKFNLWRDLFEKSSRDSAGFFQTPDGIYYYHKGTIERFLQGEWKTYLEAQQAELEQLKKALPEKYPFLQIIRDKEKPADVKVQIRGDRNNLGEVAPRRFLAILSPPERKRYTKGSGRLELAEDIVDPRNPLTARVMVNRIWQYHFGRPIVGTPSNFGQLGERPTHPELLDYLAARFIENNWSIKAMHREIMLSAVYQLSAANDETNMAKDPGNLLLWRANRRRLDVEALRDSMMFVSGTLDLTPGEKAEPLDETNTKRTIYGFVSRRKLDPTLALFDFPNPNSTSEGRLTTNVPLQRLFLMNSPFVERQAQALAARLEAGSGSTEDRIRNAYRLVFGRQPEPEELRLGQDFLAKAKWLMYARALLTSNEFLFVD
ncbi:MAG: PSD1 domain-containing protein [Bryobacteraceae bacterium]|nr:PSD1 domain-containing protein [Bryobacteraceae bacterium]